MQPNEKKGIEGEEEKEKTREAKDGEKKKEKKRLIKWIRKEKERKGVAEDGENKKDKKGLLTWIREEKERRRGAADGEKGEGLELKRGEEEGEKKKRGEDRGERRRGVEIEGEKRKRGVEDGDKRKRGEEDGEKRKRGEEEEERRKRGHKDEERKKKGEEDEARRKKGEEDTSTGVISPDSECVQHEDWDQASLLVAHDLLMDRSVVEAEREQRLTLVVWRGMNAVGEQGAGYPPSWIKDVQQTVQEAARRHFPSMPPEDSPQQELHTYLHNIQEVLTGELLRLAPLLREAGLLAAVIDGYHVHTMSQLELLMQKRLNSDQLFTLLRWTLKTYLSTVLAHPDIAADVAPVLDLLLLADWLHKTTTKALHTTQESVKHCLERVLDKEEEEGESCDQSDEEAFIRVHLDVIQCLNNIAKKAGDVSPFMKREVQTVCLTELHSFSLRFSALEERRMKCIRGAEDGKITNLFRTLSCAASEAQNKMGDKDEEKNIIHLFRTIRTCKELGRLAVQLASEAQTDADDTTGILEKLCTHTTYQLIHTAARNLEVCLQVYFRCEDVDLFEELSKEMKVLFSYLAREPDIHQFCLKAVYTQVVLLYLKHLLLSNQSQLEKRWGQVGTAIRADAEVIHEIFTQQSEDVDNRSVLLRKVATVLSFTDEETFNSTCRELRQDTHISKEQVNQLILWKDRLSRQQVKAVLDTTPQLPWKRLPTLWTQTSRSAASFV